MNFKKQKYLTMEERRELVLKGEDVPIIVQGDSKSEKRRKREKEKLAKKFYKNVL